eukprot:39111_1
MASRSNAFSQEDNAWFETEGICGGNTCVTDGHCEPIFAAKNDYQGAGFVENMNGAACTYSRHTKLIFYLLPMASHFDERKRVADADLNDNRKWFTFMLEYFDANHTQTPLGCWSIYHKGYHEMGVAVSEVGSLGSGFSMDSYSVMFTSYHVPQSKCRPYAFICKTSLNNWVRLPEDGDYYFGTEFMDWNDGNGWSTDYAGLMDRSDWIAYTCKENHYYWDGTQWIVNGGPGLDKCDIWHYKDTETLRSGTYLERTTCNGCTDLDRLACWSECGVNNDFNAAACDHCIAVGVLNYGNEWCDPNATTATAQPTAPTPPPTAPTPHPTALTSHPTSSTSHPTQSTSTPTHATSEPTAPTPQPTAPTPHPTAVTSEPTAPTAQPTAATAQPTSATLQPTTPTAQPTAPTSQPSAPSPRPTLPSIHPTTATAQPSAPTSHPTQPTSQPTVLTSQPTSPTPHPTASTSQPTRSTTQPTRSTSQPTRSTLQPTRSTSQPTSPTPHPTASTSQPTRSTTQPTLVTVQPTGSTSSPTKYPTDLPSKTPTFATQTPSDTPTKTPSRNPTRYTQGPTNNPTLTLPTTANPSVSTSTPTKYPTDTPSKTPTLSTSHPTHPTSTPTDTTQTPTESTPSPTDSTPSPTDITSPPTHATSHPSQPTSGEVTVSPTAPTPQPTGTTSPPTTGTTHPTTPTTSTSQPSPPTPHPTQSTTEPTGTTSSPTTGTTHPTTPTTSTSQPSAPTPGPTDATTQPTGITSPPTLSTANPTAPTMTPTSQPTVSTSDPTAVTSQPSAVTSPPTQATSQPTTSTTVTSPTPPGDTCVAFPSTLSDPVYKTKWRNVPSFNEATQSATWLVPTVDAMFAANDWCTCDDSSSFEYYYRFRYVSKKSTLWVYIYPCCGQATTFGAGFTIPAGITSASQFQPNSVHSARYDASMNVEASDEWTDPNQFGTKQYVVFGIFGVFLICGCGGVIYVVKRCKDKKKKRKGTRLPDRARTSKKNLAQTIQMHGLSAFPGPKHVQLPSQDRISTDGSTDGDNRYMSRFIKHKGDSTDGSADGGVTMGLTGLAPPPKFKGMHEVVPSASFEQEIPAFNARKSIDLAPPPKMSEAKPMSMTVDQEVEQLDEDDIMDAFDLDI